MMSTECDDYRETLEAIASDEGWFAHDSGGRKALAQKALDRWPREDEAGEAQFIEAASKALVSLCTEDAYGIPRLDGVPPMQAAYEALVAVGLFERQERGREVGGDGEG